MIYRIRLESGRAPKGLRGFESLLYRHFMEDQEAIALKSAIKTCLFLEDYDNAIRLSLDLAKLRTKQGKYDKVHKIVLFIIDLSKDRKSVSN